MFTSYISTPFSYEKLLAKQNKKSADLKKNISTDVLFVYYVHESLKVFDKLSSYIDESDLVKMNNFPVGIYISDINKSGVSYVLLKDQLNDMDITADKIYEIYKAFVTGTVYGNKSMHSAIYISNMMNLNVSSFVPLLKKRTCATLAISSPDAAGSYNVGLTFDHRIMEGAYVASFLSDLKMRIEK
jgi:pyruvate/2-oxoglutarate dehydrogenase complex dihydrolipoamide acyltransferase (E2) component